MSPTGLRPPNRTQRAAYGGAVRIRRHHSPPGGRSRTGVLELSRRRPRNVTGYWWVSDRAEGQSEVSGTSQRTGAGWLASRGSVRLRVQQLRFQAGDALVEEAVVGPGGLQAFFKGAVAGCEVAEPLFERAVLGGEPASGVAIMLALGVAELAEQLADAGALGADLGVRGATAAQPEHHQPEQRNLPAGLSKPAQRALAAAGYTTLDRLAEVSEADLSQLHGVGPKAIEKLRQALAAVGLSHSAKS
jgi:helix-hairpin-helix protein